MRIPSLAPLVSTSHHHTVSGLCRGEYVKIPRSNTRAYWVISCSFKECTVTEIMNKESVVSIKNGNLLTTVISICQLQNNSEQKKLAPLDFLLLSTYIK